MEMVRASLKKKSIQYIVDSIYTKPSVEGSGTTVLHIECMLPKG